MAREDLMFTRIACKLIAAVLCLLLLFSTAVLAEEPAAEVEIPDYSKVDMDLSRFSEIMVYGTLYDMAAGAERYAGKTVKLKGYIEREAGNAEKPEMFYLVAYDETNCCSMKVRILTHETSKPLKTSVEMTVCGVFDVYTENGTNCCQLLNAMAL